MVNGSKAKDKRCWDKWEESGAVETFNDANESYSSKLPPCNHELWNSGEHIATIWDVKSKDIEKIVKTASRKSGQPIDWHFVGGRATVRAAGDLDKARNYLERGLEASPLTKYDGTVFRAGAKKYRFTTDNDSVIPMSLLRGNRDSA